MAKRLMQGLIAGLLWMPVLGLLYWLECVIARNMIR